MHGTINAKDSEEKVQNLDLVAKLDRFELPSTTVSKRVISLIVMVHMIRLAFEDIIHPLVLFLRMFR